ncbi:MAG: protein kinase domain-containing protein, partial [Streptosporangiaceae bacterium]
MPMTVFGGRYQQVRLLGKGGMGEVWLALDEELGGRPVAIKIMSSRLLADQEGVDRFRQELRLAARMHHPNILTVFTSGTDNGIPFMVMEYLEGHDLRRLPPGWGSGEVAGVGRQTCAALAYAHGLNVVHRDITPGNLFLCDTGLVKVTDFGIAKALTASKATKPGTMIGTLPYMAPEQWLGMPATFSIDIWATGCVLYELLSGRRPREYSMPAEYIAAAARGDRVAPLTGLAGLPSWLAGAVMAMLEPNPADRPTAAECVQLLSGSPARSMPAPEPETRRPPAQATRQVTSAVTIGNTTAFVPAGPSPEGHDPAQGIYQLRFSPDGRFLAASVAGGALIWDIRTGELVGPGRSELFADKMKAPRLEFTADSHFLLMVSGSSVRLWNNLARRPVSPSPRITTDADLLPSRDARYVATTSGKSLFLWNIGWDRATQKTGPYEMRKRGGGLLGNAAFSAGGGILAAAGNHGDIHFWDTVTHQVTGHRLKGNFFGVNQILFSPDGRLVATLARESSVFSNRTVTLWDISGRHPESWVVVEKSTLSSDYVYGSYFSADSRVLAVNFGNEVILWDIRARRAVGTISPPATGSVGTLMFSPHGRTMITVDDGFTGGSVRIWDLETLQMVGQLTDPPAAIVLAEMSPDGSLIATVGHRGSMPAGPGSAWTLRLWRAAALPAPRSLSEWRDAVKPLEAGDPRQVGGYTLIGRLGQGGMGQVFLGVSPGGRQVAVKLIRREHAADTHFRIRFAREVAAARRVGGFHTAPVVDANSEADPPWMVTAYIPGPSLDSAVRDRGPLGVAAVQALGAALAEGLAAIHACGLVHRDLKPGNIILADDGPRIIDFGIAHAADASTLTATGMVIGTFPYMSPEQISGTPVGPTALNFRDLCRLREIRRDDRDGVVDFFGVPVLSLER